MVFKVPSLRNVEKTAPYFHSNLEAALVARIRPRFDPAEFLEAGATQGGSVVAHSASRVMKGHEPGALGICNGGPVASEEQVPPGGGHQNALERSDGFGHVVGMCGDGANDAPALRQAQIGIAVSSATDVAKAAAAVVLTEPGLSGIVSAIREGRIAFQRLLIYTLNMLLKKIEIVLLLAVGLAITGDAVMTPVLMVLMLVTNDFLSMSLTTNRASPAPGPSAWNMRRIIATALVFGICKLGFSTATVAFGRFRLGLGPQELQTLTFVTLVFGKQALLYVLRERRRMWHSMPSIWLIASSALDIGIVSTLAFSGTLMQPLPWRLLADVAGAAIVFALILDQIKPPILSVFKVGR